MRLCRGVRRYPHIAFVPTIPRLEGLFHRLQNLPLEEHQGKWRLCSHLSESWKDLEDRLIYVSNILMGLRISSPLHFEPFPFPSKFGYLRSHTTREIAFRAACNSRQAFIQLGSLCTYAIAMSAHTQSDLDGAAPRWMKCLHQKGVHHTWVEAFRQSQFADFQSTLRFGTVVHAGLDWLNEVREMIRARVPIWVDWGQCENTNLFINSAPFLQSFQPDPAATRNLFSSFDPTPANPAPDDLSSVVFDSHRHLRDPAQQEGESWRDFLTRQLAALERVKASENSKARLARENRELASRSWSPSKKGPFVFRWEEEEQTWIRIQLTRREASDWWETTPRSQRMFFSHLNQWDLFPESVSDPSLDPPEDEWEDEDYEIELALDKWELAGLERLYPPSGNSLPDPPIDSPAPTAPMVAAQHSSDPWLKTLTMDYLQPSSFETAAPSLDRRPFDQIIYTRYGFSPCLEYKPPSTSDTGVTWDSLKKSLGHSSAADPEKRRTTECIRQFFSILQSRLLMEDGLCDLFQKNSRFLPDLCQRNIEIEVWSIPPHKVYYELIPTHPLVTTPWVLLVSDPLSVLQCIREDWGSCTSTIEIARIMLSLGIPFVTLGPSPASPPRHLLYRQPSNGLDPGEHLRGPQDYLQYENSMRAFLKLPHARAALMEGGLVWRLVKEIVGDRLDEEVLYGPSQYVRQFGIPFVKHRNMWDDQLTEAEFDFILGMNKTYTGKWLALFLSPIADFLQELGIS